jgi:predicted hydrocarbon binding protein
MKGIMLKGMEEVMGRPEVSAVLNLSGLSLLNLAEDNQNHESVIFYHDFSQVQDTLETLYGLSGGQGLALKTGRVFFSLGLREYGLSLGLLDLDFRLLPPAVKFKKGLQSISRFLTQKGEAQFRVEEDPLQFTWIVEKCPACWHRHSDVPICHIYVGMLQEFSFWTSGGKNYRITETECSAMGANACVFTIEKKALE